MFAVLLRRFFGCDLLSESEAFRAKGSGTSLAVQRLGRAFQCREHRFSPWSGS